MTEVGDVRAAGRRPLLRWGLVLAALAVVVGAYAGLRWTWSRGDVDVDAVVARLDDTQNWVLEAEWSGPTDGNGCVAGPWKVETSGRGYEVFSSAVAPPSTSFDAMCRIGTSSIVLGHPGSDPTGTTVVVNGESFVVTAAA
ncbi:MAG: hypothetical protein AB7O74_16325 [Candidatus Nanopelagicales bacterium]